MTGYEFSVIRYVHSVATHEFVNVGLALWVPSDRQFSYYISDRYSRLSSFFHGFDGPGYRQTIRALARRMKRVSEEINGEGRGRLILEDDLSFEKIRAQLIRDDASTFQWSDVFGGIADDPTQRLRQLAEEFVERFEAVGPRERRDEAEIGHRIEVTLAQRGILPSLQSGVELRGHDYSYRFRFGWMNGAQQVLEPISFDYLNGTDVIEKANNWSGKLLNLSRGAEFAMTGVVARPSRRDLGPAFEKAVRILQAAPRVRRIVTEEQFEDVIPAIQDDLRH